MDRLCIHNGGSTTPNLMGNVLPSPEIRPHIRPSVIPATYSLDYSSSRNSKLRSGTFTCMRRTYIVQLLGAFPDLPRLELHPPNFLLTTCRIREFDHNSTSCVENDFRYLKVRDGDCPRGQNGQVTNICVYLQLTLTGKSLVMVADCLVTCWN